MKKYLSILILSVLPLLSFLSNPPVSFADILYSNDFTSSVPPSGWSTNSGSATVDANGLESTNYDMVRGNSQVDTITHFKWINVNSDSYLYFYCRQSSSGDGQGFQLDNYGTSRARATISGVDHFYNFSDANISNGAHNFEVDCIGTDMTIIEDGNTIYNSSTNSDLVYNGSQSWTRVTFAGSLGFYYLCNTSGSCTDPFVTPTPTPSTPQIKVTPNTTDVTVGTPFNVTVAVDGGTTAFNAAKATVAVSSNLTVTGIHNPTSNACNLQYTETPIASNPSFAGAIYSSSSTSCNVYTLTLTSNTTGTGTITFTNGSVKAYADSSEVLNTVQNGSYTINAVSATPTPTPPLSGLAITSGDETYLTSFTLTGTKDVATTHVFVNGSETGVTYPTNTTWQKTVTLVLGDNTFTVYGADDNGNQTATITGVVSRHTLGDINGDGTVDLTDASLFAVDWGKTDPSTFTYALSDMNNDGKVDLTDLSILAKLVSE